MGYMVLNIPSNYEIWKSLAKEGGAYIARNSFAKEGVTLDFVGLGLQMHWVVLQTQSE